MVFILLRCPAGVGIERVGRRLRCVHLAPHGRLGRVARRPGGRPRAMGGVRRVGPGPTAPAVARGPKDAVGDGGFVKNLVPFRGQTVVLEQVAGSIILVHAVCVRCRAKIHGISHRKPILHRPSAARHHGSARYVANGVFSSVQTDGSPVKYSDARGHYPEK